MQDIFVKNSPFQNTRQQSVEPLARLQSACTLLFNNKQRKRARATHTQARTPCHAQIHGILKTSFGLQTFCIPFPTTTCPEKKKHPRSKRGRNIIIIQLYITGFTSWKIIRRTISRQLSTKPPWRLGITTSMSHQTDHNCSIKHQFLNAFPIQMPLHLKYTGPCILMTLVVSTHTSTQS